MTTIGRELKERLKKASALYGIEFLSVPVPPDYNIAILMGGVTVFSGYDRDCIRFMDGLIKAENVRCRTASVV